MKKDRDGPERRIKVKNITKNFYSKIWLKYFIDFHLRKNSMHLKTTN